MRWCGPLPRGDERGQMAVEVAVLAPVVIVVALTVLNLLQFVNLCALFDRISYDAVISQGVSPAGVVNEGSAVEAVRSCITDALASSRCEVRVSASRASGDPSGPGFVFPVSPLLTDYTCTLVFRPWPSSFVIAGVPYQSPLVLTHTRSIVVDRYRAGVVG